jgi:5'-nucleotidase/2',3'-cyclic-nucleotide 2'-phosphodiesterase/3'-nucleotidase/5'-nucleotidase
MRKISVIIIILLTCSGIAAVPINIFHTNDTHGVYVPRIIKSGERTSQLGGYATLEHFLNLERQKAPRSLYLDAGDQQTGSIFSELKHNGRR